MTIMVIGLGSMGNRRLRLLKALRPSIHLVGVDVSEQRRAQAEKKYGIPTYSCIDHAIERDKPMAAVISTAPLSHAEIIRKCLMAGLHVFTELNLVSDGYIDNMALAKKNERVLFLSSTFFYREEVRHIIWSVQNSCDILNYRYHIGQYLPDWHPWENYNDFFVGDSRTNGCREIFAIELPWLQKAFGPIEKLHVICGKCTELKVSYPDSYMVLLQHKTGHMGSLCVDIVSRKAVRNFEVYGENLTITWGGTPDSLKEWNVKQGEERVIQICQQAEHLDSYADFVIENAYAEELKAFLGEIEQKCQKSSYGFPEDLETLRLIDKIEELGE